MLEVDGKIAGYSAFVPSPEPTYAEIFGGKWLEDASDTLRIVRIGDYDACACIGTHVTHTAEVGTFKILSHDFEVGRWRVRWKVIPLVI